MGDETDGLKPGRRVPDYAHRFQQLSRGVRINRTTDARPEKSVRGVHNGLSA